MSKMKSNLKKTEKILTQTVFSDPVLNRTYKGNTSAINTCIFNPNM